MNVIGTASFDGTVDHHPGGRVVPGTYTLLTADTLRGTPPTLNAPMGDAGNVRVNFETLADQIRLIITGSPPKKLTCDWALGLGVGPQHYGQLDRWRRRREVFQSRFCDVWRWSRESKYRP